MTIRTASVDGTTAMRGTAADIMNVLIAASVLDAAAVLPGERAAALPTAAAADAAAAPAVAPPPPVQRSGKTQYTRPNGEEFFARKIMFGDQETTDIELTRGWLAEGLHPFYVGKAGCGKTAMIEAATHDWSGSNGLVTMMGTASTTASDFTVTRVPQPDGTFRTEIGPLAVAAQDGKVFYIDEIGRIEPRELTVVYSVMDGRGEFNIPEAPELGTIVCQPGFKVIASTNPDAPGCIIDDALLNRFMPGIEYTTDFSIAVKYLGVKKEVAALAKDMTKQVKAGTAYWAPTMRTLLQWKKIAKINGERAAWQGLVTAAPEEARQEVAAAIERAVGIKVEAAAWEM
jgi:nitric oxide reductase NorQ protein